MSSAIVPEDDLVSECPSEINSTRLLLRPYRPGEGQLYVDIYRDNHAHLFEFKPRELRGMESAADAERHIQWLLRAWQDKEIFVFGVWVRATGGYVGEAYLANPDWDVPSLELGYFVVAQQTGRGIATEAGAALVDMAFVHLGVARIDLQCTADNLASTRVAERLGFRLEGRHRQRHRKRNGELVDRLWYGLLHTEWEARPSLPRSTTES
jgi:RimJ/RimL family protein N-acetyltransferase